MPENDEENTDAQEGAEDKTSDDSNDDDILSSIEDEEVREQVRDKITEKQEQKKHWRSKAEQNEQKLEELQQALADDTGGQDDSDEGSDDGSDTSDVDRIYSVTQKVGDLSEDEFKELKSKAHELGVDTEKFLDSDVGQKYLKSYRKENQVAESTPGPSNRGATVNNKQISDMSEDELRENWNEITGSSGGGNNLE